ncbi:hypothetical protein JW921_01495 [Candidatus Fermentibacterales bacterium]|nr:hypothetical protein [Candidatus Fermentibacterales bacterium]
MRPCIMVDLGLGFMSTSLNERSLEYFDFEVPHGRGTAGVAGARAGLQLLGGLGIYGEARAWFWGVGLWDTGGAGGDQWLIVAPHMYGGGLCYVRELSEGKLIAGIRAGLGSYGGRVQLRQRGTIENVWEGDLESSLGFNFGALFGGPIRWEPVDAFWVLDLAYHNADLELEDTYTGVHPGTEDMELFDLKAGLKLVL